MTTSLSKKCCKVRSNIFKQFRREGNQISILFHFARHLVIIKLMLAGLLRVLILAIVLLLAEPLVEPANGQVDSPVTQAVQKAKNGQISQEQLADYLISYAETDPALIVDPNALLFQFPGFADVIGPKLEQRVVDQIRGDKLGTRKQLEKFAVKMFGVGSKYTKNIVRINELSDEFERKVNRGTVDTAAEFQASLSTDLERELFEARLENFLRKMVERHATIDEPMLALRSLARFGAVTRAAGGDALVEKLVINLAQQAQTGKFNWQQWTLGEDNVETFLLEVAKDRPEIKQSLIAIYLIRVRRSVIGNNFQDAEDSLAWLLTHRPDPNQVNNELRRSLVVLVSNPDGKQFAVDRVQELADLDQLGALDEIYYYWKGYYAEGLLITTFWVTISIIIAALVALYVLGKYYFPSISFSRWAAIIEEKKKNRYLKKAQERGVGYLNPVEVKEEEKQGGAEGPDVEIGDRPKV